MDGERVGSMPATWNFAGPGCATGSDGRILAMLARAGTWTVPAGSLRRRAAFRAAVPDGTGAHAALMAHDIAVGTILTRRKPIDAGAQATRSLGHLEGSPAALSNGASTPVATAPQLPGEAFGRTPSSACVACLQSILSDRGACSNTPIFHLDHLREEAVPRVGGGSVSCRLPRAAAVSTSFQCRAKTRVEGYAGGEGFSTASSLQ